MELTALGVPRAGRLDRGLWAILSEAHVPLQGESEAQQPAPVPVQLAISPGGVAVLAIRGVLTKGGGWWGPSTVELRQAVRQLARDEQVRGVVLAIDSPGGTVAGTEELAREVAELSRAKPTAAVIEDLGASAAYWIATQAREVYATGPTSLVGSIGTYLGVYDFSAMFEQVGVRAIRIATGPHKGAGMLGTEITAEQQAEFQRIVDAIQESFSAAVATARGLDAESLAAVTTGTVWTAREAERLGLIDGIRSLDEVIAGMPAGRKGGRAMAEEQTTGQVPAVKELAAPLRTTATIAEIRGACPGATAEFVLGQVERGATLAEAREAWLAERERQVAEREQQIAAQQQARAAAGGPGVTPVAEVAAAENRLAHAAVEFRREVEALGRAGIPRAEAVRRLARERPELREALVEEANTSRRR